MIESERKFILYNCPIVGGKWTTIIQSYLIISNSIEIRIRDSIFNKVLTIKVGTNNEFRYEFEYEIPNILYRFLYRFCKYSISKCRMIIDKNIVVDRFEDIYFARTKERLCILEIEYPTIEEFREAKIPNEYKDLIVREVTFSREFKNKNLAKSNLNHYF